MYLNPFRDLWDVPLLERVVSLRFEGRFCAIVIACDDG